MRTRGFTMIELLVVITISAILVAAAIPSMNWLIRSTRVSSAANSLLASMDIARSEAIRRNVVVTVCRSLNPEAAVGTTNCSSVLGGGFAADDWAAGWIVFAKNPLNVAPDNTVWEGGAFPDEVIQRQAFPVPSVERLIVDSTLPAAQRWSFGPNGLRLGGAIGTTFTIDYRDPQVATLSGLARCLGLNISGAAMTARPVNGSC